MWRIGLAIALHRTQAESPTKRIVSIGGAAIPVPVSIPHASIGDVSNGDHHDIGADRNMKSLTPVTTLARLRL